MIDLHAEVENYKTLDGQRQELGQWSLCLSDPLKLCYFLPGWPKCVNIWNKLDLVENERVWWNWNRAVGAGAPDSWVMFSGVYFWTRSSCFNVIEFDSTTNGARAGDVEKMHAKWMISPSIFNSWAWLRKGEQTTSQVWTDAGAQAKPIHKTCLWRMWPRRLNNHHPTFLTGAQYGPLHSSAHQNKSSVDFNRYQRKQN